MNYTRTPCKQKPSRGGHKHTYRVCDASVLWSQEFWKQWLQLADVMKEQSLVASWGNAAKPSPNCHYVPVCAQKKLIPIYLQAHRLVNTRGYCVLPGREALWENHHLSRVRCGFHCDVRQPVLLIARAYDFIQENKTPHMCSCEPTRASASVSEANFSLKHKAKRVHLI